MHADGMSNTLHSSMYLMPLLVDNPIANDPSGMPSAGETIAIGLLISFGIVGVIALLLFAFKGKLKP